MKRELARLVEKHGGVPLFNLTKWLTREQYRGGWKV